MARPDEQKTENQKVEKQNTPMSRKKKLIIVGVAIVASVALVSSVVAFTMGYELSLPGTEDGQENHGEASAKKGPPVIYALEPFIVNIHDGQDMRYLKVKIDFETNAGPDPKVELDPYLAPLRDSILLLLTSKTLQDVLDLEGKNRLRGEILAATGKILPAGKVSRVFFTDFMVQ